MALSDLDVINHISIVFLQLRKLKHEWGHYRIPGRQADWAA